MAPELRKGYRDVLRAAAKMDADGLLRVASRAPGHVMFNVERTSIQVVSCDRRSVIANVPLVKKADIATAHRQLERWDPAGVATVAHRF